MRIVKFCCPDLSDATRSYLNHLNRPFMMQNDPEYLEEVAYLQPKCTSPPSRMQVSLDIKTIHLSVEEKVKYYFDVCDIVLLALSL